MRADLGAPVAPWRAAVAAAGPASVPPVSGSVRARREIPEIGVTVLTLSNGVNVWLKPTDFGGDVTFTGVSPGGASLASPENFLSASMSGLLVGSAGAGGLSPQQRSGQPAGQNVRVSPLVATSFHGIAGTAKPADLDAALELTHLFFTAPNLDAAAFQPARRLIETAMANQMQNPAYALVERMTRVNASDHYTVRAPRPEEVAQMDDAVIAAFYRARFANAANFTFFIVGAFDINSVTPLVARHLATLPSTGVADARAVDLRPVFPASIVRETVTRGREPRSQTALTFFADTGLDDVEISRARAAAAVLQTRLTAVLREELGAIYSVAVNYADMAPQRGYGTMAVRFGSAPEASERLTTLVLTEVERLRTEGPTSLELQAAKATMSRTLTMTLQQNAHWMTNLQMAHLLGRDPARIPMVTGIVDALTAESVRDASRKYMALDRYTVVTLMPGAK
jgi:zinc protease